ncbi:MAG: hypothetical protein K2P94_15455, partial [Rhodospirillaceae bacterium]|nr:hypothetical protein [Rhodospirillaceae bacterium]
MNRVENPRSFIRAESVAEDQARWERETRAPYVAQHPERKDTFKTQALKWPVKSIYTPADLDAVGFDYHADLGFPGEFPFTRGTNPNGHRSNL